MENEKGYEILNKEAVKDYLKNLKYPIYFLDFESISENKQWMYEHGLAIDQHLASFSLLKVEKNFDDETKIKHFNFLTMKENYKLMAKKLTDFYKDINSPVIVWDQNLEIRGLAKLMKESNQLLHKKFSSMISNIIDLQQLFINSSFIKLKNSSKSSISNVANSFGVYLKTNIKNGRNAHYILVDALKKDYIKDLNFLKYQSFRLMEYNNSDVINSKRILDKIIEDIELKI